MMEFEEALSDTACRKRTQPINNCGQTKRLRISGSIRPTKRNDLLSLKLFRLAPLGTPACLPSLFERLPDDVLAYIFTFLQGNLTTARALCLVSRRFRDTAMSCTPLWADAMLRPMAAGALACAATAQHRQLQSLQEFVDFGKETYHDAIVSFVSTHRTERFSLNALGVFESECVTPCLTANRTMEGTAHHQEGFIGLTASMLSNVFVHCSRLVSLTIHCLCDEGLAVIAASCPLLQRFEINHDAVCECTCAVTDVGVTVLAAHCPHLRALSLSGFPAAGAPPEHALALLENGCMDRLTELALPRLAGEDETGITDDVCIQLLRHGAGLLSLDLSWNSLLTARAISAIQKCCPKLDQLAISGFPLFCAPTPLVVNSVEREMTSNACAKLVELSVQKISSVLVSRAHSLGSASNLTLWLCWLSMVAVIKSRSPEILCRFCGDEAFLKIKCLDVDGCEWLDDSFVLCMLALQPNLNLCNLRQEGGVSEQCAQFYHSFRPVMAAHNAKPGHQFDVELQSVRSYLASLSL